LGWHIIKLLDKQKIGSFEDEKDLITTKIEKDGRSQITQQAFIKRLKTSYQYQDNAPYLRAFTKKVNKMVLFGKWRADSIKNDALDKILFTVNMPKGDLQKPELVKTNFTEADFAAYIEKNQKRAKTKAVELTVNRLFNNFVEGLLIKAEEKMLPVKNPDFGRLVKEFRDGNLLYELMGEKVWNKAMQDTLGLQAFYEKNQQNYLWPQRLDAAIISAPNTEIVDEIRQKIAAGEDAKTLEKTLKEKGGTKNMRIDSDLYPKEQNKIIDKIEWKVGLSENVKNNDGSISFVQVYSIVEPSPKQLSEARGYVIADYQTELEKAWIVDLRKKYPVNIDNAVLKTLYKR
jgi:peptidyl-prolyl cis-trans isomerase SurA